MAVTLGVVLVAGHWSAPSVARVPAAWLAAGQVVGLGALLLGLVAWLTRRDPNRVESLGLGPTRRWSSVIAWGLAGALGTAVASAVAALIWVVASRGLGRATAAASVGGSVAAKSAAMAALGSAPFWLLVGLSMVAGIYEEIVFRGFVLRRLCVALGARSEWTALGAAVLAALPFALAHGYQGPLGVLQSFVAGVCFGTLAVLSGGIRAAIVAHAAVDVLGSVLLASSGR